MSATGMTLQTLRESFKLSRLDIAAEFDLTDRWVEMLESGRINPNAAFVAKYKRAVLRASQKKNAPEAGQGYGGSDQNPYQEEQIVKNATPSSVLTATDTVRCNLQGCVSFNEAHDTNLGEEPLHTAFEWRLGMHCQVSVDFEAGEWVISGVLSDDDQQLVPEAVTAWMANYNSAVCLAAELNAQGATC
ncbi:helix-turn-helix domain-containing protein [Curtobacterium sp. L1-20]|uniref:helix-turn-helix domain-containing protein n=1 Tax=Curtobacterium sp. L1-20 TaxID=3138181 RepID=UPI003B518171